MPHPCYTTQMSQRVIGIGGAYSGAGKTTVACQIVRALVAEDILTAAIKFTPDPLYTSITDFDETRDEPGKDTTLLMEAGAAEALWVRSPRGSARDALAMAMDRLSAYEVVVVEGNSAIEVLKPCIVLFITGGQGPDCPEKESSRLVSEMADVFIHDGPSRRDVPAGAEEFSRDEAGAYTAHVVSRLKGDRGCQRQ